MFKQNGIYYCRYADQVLVGDEILVQNNNELIPDKVIKESNFVMEGKNLFQIIYKLVCNDIISNTTLTHILLKNEIKMVTFISLFQVPMSLWQWRETLWLITYWLLVMLPLAMIWLTLQCYQLENFLQWQNGSLVRKMNERYINVRLRQIINP